MADQAIKRRWAAVDDTKEGAELEIDPDPRLEREAEETAQRVMQGSELGIQRLATSEVHVQRVDKTRREMIRGDVSAEELATGFEDADLGTVDPERLRDAYKFAEHAVTFGTTASIVQPLVTEFGLSRPEAMAVTLAVGGTIHVGRDRLNHEDIYITLEVAKLLGAEEHVLEFFSSIGADVTGDEIEEVHGGRE